ncbi:flagellar hook-length control protein FliK [Luteibacter aegosomaticola]|uniref:flagellar hook-length control protein FliK n=1 Tax=Luteibacter aegosomaticola TaxID=2911538 RepID=UPI001FFC289C|nr:flagellar hook-length control protein FliK [Luteibacter aegosomaticola]UPG89171.1 flagellar hook-length control protein FliK [Luteibacter aegosomaticola]
MIIQPTSLAAQLWAGAAAGTTAATTQTWAVGTLLSARLLAQIDVAKVLLDIGGVAVEADAPGTSLPQQFQVRVMTQGPQPQMEVVLGNTDERVAMQGLRERLPQQNGYSQLLSVLSALSRRPVARVLPEPLRTALATLEASISKPEDLGTPEGMKQAIAKSGAFLEAHLAEPQNEAPAADDFKAALLNLRRALTDIPQTRQAMIQAPSRPFTDTPPPLAQRALVAQPRAEELRTQEMLADEETADGLVSHLRTDVRAAVSRVEIGQLESQPHAGLWMIEIPLTGVRGYDVLQLRIEEGKPSAIEPEGMWTVGFAIDPPTLGAVQGEVQLRGTRVSVRLWAQYPETVARLEDEFTTLRRVLEKSGLQLDHFACMHGLPVPTSAYSAVLLEARA